MRQRKDALGTNELKSPKWRIILMIITIIVILLSDVQMMRMVWDVTSVRTAGSTDYPFLFREITLINKNTL